jgi:hypothetical protein
MVALLASFAPLFSRRVWRCAPVVVVGALLALVRRMLKVQQKVPGSFRSTFGAVAFAHLRGNLSTLRKQSHAVLAALEGLFTSQPLYSAFA